MKTIKLTIESNTNSYPVTLVSQPIYSDFAQATYGDGREGDSQYVATVFGPLKIDDSVTFQNQAGEGKIIGHVWEIETPVTGETILTIREGHAA